MPEQEMPKKEMPQKTDSLKKTVIIAGGGTGGHIYPGVAIAKALESLHADCRIQFVGARGGLEEKIVPREGFSLEVVDIGKLHSSVGLGTRLKTLLKIPFAFWQSLRLLRKYRPVAVLGVGGYASGPVVFVASLLGYRTLVWEPNAFPGMANRILSRFVDECLVVFADAAKYFKCRVITPVGLPVRSSIHAVPRAKGQPLRVLVFGGSQGARAINQVVSDAVLQGGDWLRGVELVHQTGTADFQKVQKVYQSVQSSNSQEKPAVQVLEYLHDMDARYAWADLIVCRSGASTVAEVCVAQKAAVFIPLPTAADNHQQKNAEVLVRENAAVMVVQKEFTPAKFKDLVVDFRDHREKIGQYQERVAKFKFADAARMIVDRILIGDKNFRA